MLALIDTHTHLFTEEFDADRELAIIRAKEAGVTRMFMPNIDDTSVEAMLALCNSHDGCYPMIGFHPTSVDENWKERLAVVEKWLRSEQTFYGFVLGQDIPEGTDGSTGYSGKMGFGIQFAVDYPLP